MIICTLATQQKQSTYAHSSPLYIPIPSSTQDPSASKAGRASKGDSSCPFFFSLCLLLSRQAIVLLLQIKAKQSLPAQRSPSLSLNRLLNYPVPFAHLVCVYLFSRDVKIPREPMAQHQLGILRQHSSRSCVRSQPWAEL
jgi:hypothetical protein